MSADVVVHGFKQAPGLRRPVQILCPCGWEHLDGEAGVMSSIAAAWEHADKHAGGVYCIIWSDGDIAMEFRPDRPVPVDLDLFASAGVTL